MTVINQPLRKAMDRQRNGLPRQTHKAVDDLDSRDDMPALMPIIHEDIIREEILRSEALIAPALDLALTLVNRYMQHAVGIDDLQGAAGVRRAVTRATATVDYREGSDDDDDDDEEEEDDDEDEDDEDEDGEGEEYDDYGDDCGGDDDEVGEDGRLNGRPENAAVAEATTEARNPNTRSANQHNLLALPTTGTATGTGTGTGTLLGRGTAAAGAARAQGPPAGPRPTGGFSLPQTAALWRSLCSQVESGSNHQHLLEQIQRQRQRQQQSWHQQQHQNQQNQHQQRASRPAPGELPQAARQLPSLRQSNATPTRAPAAPPAGAVPAGRPSPAPAARVTPLSSSHLTSHQSLLKRKAPTTHESIAKWLKTVESARLPSRPPPTPTSAMSEPAAEQPLPVEAVAPDTAPAPVEDAKPANDAEPAALPAEVVDLKAAAAAEEEDVATPISRDEDPKSRRVSLADLSARGTTLYAHKNYDDAAEIFSKASAMQAELNGETAPENAEILFHYGRSVFKVGQSKSDVLGGPAAADKKAKPANGGGAASSKNPVETDATKATKEGPAPSAADNKDEGHTDTKKPLFQFTGDENFDESDDEEDEEQEEEEDDLATAFEILDLARVCYMKQLEQLQQEEEAGKGKEAAEDSPAVRHIKERLADTHDCLAEISLENERYPAAIEDGRISLNYKMELYPEDSEIIAEAHYKLSLALEFASVTMSGDDGKNEKREAMDQDLRDEAIKEMELAIKSFKLKIQATEVELATSSSPEDNELTRKAIAGMREVAADMEQRLVDLRKDPIDASDLLGGDAAANALGGLLGAVTGESAADKQARVEEAAKNATDLSGLVRKKKAKEPEAAPEAPAATSTNGKRKAEDEALPEGGESPKKAKVEEGDAAVEA
ncbi:histone H1-binding protein [Purpureocillium lavendulum]|uniref:Histone H1-binding protein n=1 Tax=Purpureocillium lavendulum TaxID=1247861 RepID=A0AB34FVQ5_9HYPO|nr:histone H1-binding protein [Purpureocillium lavendulum]